MAVDCRRSGLVAFITLGHRRRCVMAGLAFGIAMEALPASRPASPNALPSEPLRPRASALCGKVVSMHVLQRSLCRPWQDVCPDSPGAWCKGGTNTAYRVRAATCIHQHHIESRLPHASIVAPCMCSMSRPKQAQTKALASETPRAKQCG